MARRLFIRLVALGGSLLIAVLAAEFLSRIVIGPPSREFQVYDSEMGWRNEAGASGWRVTVDYRHWQSVNEKGLRGEFVPSYSRKSDDVFRVLVLGDSFVEGAGVSDHEVFPAALSKRLNGADQRGEYEVINFGVSGYSTDQELLAFEREGVKYDPDVTILAFVYNDLEGNVASNASGATKPRFELTPDTQSALGFIPNPPRPDQAAFLKFKTQLRQRSRLYALATDAIHKLQFTREFLGALHVIEASDGEPPAKPFGFFAVDNQDSAGAAWALTETLVGRLANAVDCQGGRFCVVYVPPSFSVHDEDWTQFQTQFGGGYERHAVRDRLREQATRQGIEFWDLTPALSAAANQDNDRVYYRHDTHWTPRGHAIVAAELEKLVEQHKATLQSRSEAMEPSCAERITAEARE
ncbi:MAG: SGNH/GDSL hydrolase family protein [Bryobacterales bacterium]